MKIPCICMHTISKFHENSTKNVDLIYMGWTTFFERPRSLSNRERNTIQSQIRLVNTVKMYLLLSILKGCFDSIVSQFKAACVKLLLQDDV